MSLREAIQNANDEERAEALRELMRFPLGPRTFEAWCETNITCPMENCILSQGADQILLYKRPPDDPYYPGQYHVTGGVTLPGQTQDAVWERLSTGPKYGLAEAKISKPTKIGVIDTKKGHQHEGGSPRGQERNMIHVSFFCGGKIASEDHEWFRLDDLPRDGSERLLGHHQNYVDRVLLPWLGRV